METLSGLYKGNDVYFERSKEPLVGFKDNRNRS